MFGTRRSPAFADVFHGVGHGNAGEAFQAFKAELTGDAQANRSTVRRGNLLAVHPIRKQNLRMPCIGHIKAAPPPAQRKGFVGERKEDDVLCPGRDSGQIQNMGKRDTGPFGDEGPTFFASLVGDLGAGWETLQFSEGEGRGASNQSANFPAKRRWYVSLSGGPPFTGQIFERSLRLNSRASESWGSKMRCEA